MGDGEEWLRMAQEYGILEISGAYTSMKVCFKGSNVLKIVKGIWSSTKKSKSGQAIIHTWW